jgi:hypothetical protein
MKQKKVKLTAQDILQFYAEKPVFDRSQTDAAIKYGWASTKDGLYSISDFYRYFEEKGHSKNDVDDVIYKNFHKCEYNYIPSKIEKGKIHFMKMIPVTNFHPDYKKGKTFMSTFYYFVDISNEQAIQLRKEYEQDSKEHIQILLERKVDRQPEKSALQKAKAEKLKPRKNSIKKSPVVEIELK